MSTGRYTLGDKLQDHVAATQRHVAATNRFVSTGEFLRKSLFLQQNFVAATRRNKIKSDRICATCCGEKNSVVETETFTKILQYT